MEDTTRMQIRLLVLVLLAFLPAVGLYWYASDALRAYALERQQEELLRVAQGSTVEYQQLVDDSRSLLGALTLFPEIRGASHPECSDRLAGILDHAPRYTTLSLIGPDGYLACGSLTPDQGLYLGDRAYYRIAIATNQFAVGDYALGRITGRPTVGVAYPIASDGGRPTVLAASIDLGSLGNDAVATTLPEGATFTVLDRSGRVLVRIPAVQDPMGRDTVGARVPSGFPDLPSGDVDPALADGVDLDGVERMFAVSPLRGGGARAEGFLFVGKDKRIVYDQVNEVVRGELRYLTVAGVAVLFLAWTFGQFTFVRAGPVKEEGEEAEPTA